MARRWSKSIKYDSVSAYVSPTTTDYTSGIDQIHRTQSVNFRLSPSTISAKGMGHLEENFANSRGPSSQVNLTYYVTDGWNEKKLGLIVDGIHGALYGQLRDERDLFLLVDDTDDEDGHVFSFGNCLMSNYSMSAAVGTPAMASVSFVGFNTEVVNGTSGNQIPRETSNGERYTGEYILPEKSSGVYEKSQDFIDSNMIVAHHDIELLLDDSGVFGANDNKYLVESVDLNVEMPRGDVIRMRDAYPFDRSLQLPVNVEFNTSVIVLKNEVQNFKEYICEKNRDITLTFFKSCGVYDDQWNRVDKKPKLQYKMAGMRATDVENSVSIDDRMRVNVNFEMSLGNLLDSKKNFWMSGDFGELSMIPYGYSYNTSGNFLETGELPIVRTVEYEIVKGDVVSPDYSFDFSGDFNYNPDHEFLWGISMITGELDLLYENSGLFGSGLTPYYEYWNSALLPPRYENEYENPYRKLWSGISVPYATGWSGYYDIPAHGYNVFYTKSEGMYQGDFRFGFISSDHKSAGAFRTGDGSVSLIHPYFINGASVFCTDPDTPTGSYFEGEFFIESNDYRRNFRLGGYTEEEVYVYKMTHDSGELAAVWYDFYDLREYTFNGSDVSGVGDISFFVKKDVSTNPVSGITITTGSRNDRTCLLKTGSLLGHDITPWDDSFQYSGSGIDFINSFSIFIACNPTSGYADADSTESWPKLVGFYDGDNFGSGIFLGMSGNGSNPDSLVFNKSDESGVSIINLSGVTGIYEPSIYCISYDAFLQKLDVRRNKQTIYSDFMARDYYSGSCFKDMSTIRVFEKTLGEVYEVIGSSHYFNIHDLLKMEHYLGSKYSI